MRVDERNQYITYHNISVTVSFLMRLNEFDEPNHMSIARDDCLAYFTFDLRLYLDEDNYLEPISYNVTFSWISNKLHFYIYFIIQ